MTYIGWALGGLVLLLALSYAGFLVYGQLIERPPYQLVAADGAKELRRYPEMLAAEITTRGPRQAAVSAGFSPLARFIFASDRPGEKIAMTAPVTQTPVDDGWRVRFFMPARYDMQDLPRPANGDVRLVAEPAGRFAAIRFSGRPGDAEFARREQELRDWMARQGLTAAGAPVLAYYNDPMTPGPIRRNEVLIRVAD